MEDFDLGTGVREVRALRVWVDLDLCARRRVREGERERMLGVIGVERGSM